MALVLKDRVKETSTTAGTGTITLAGAVAGFQSFAAVGNGNTTYYAIVDPTTGDWEVGIGTYTSSGTTLSRTTVLSSSNSGSLVNFAANQKDVFVTYPSEKSVYEDASNVVNATSFGAITATSAALTTGTVSTTPTSNTDIANKQYVDTISASGIHYHEPVFVESPDTAGNLNATYNNGASGVGATLTNAGTQVALTIDGVLMTTGKRVLIYNQTNAAQNGVYTVTTVGSGSTNWVLTRATDADTYSPFSPNSLGQGDAFFVTNGLTGAGETYICNTVGTITFGTTAITFAQISDSTLYTAGTGLTLTGTEFSITPTGTAGTYGSASSVPVLTTNASGQVTSVTNTTIAINGSQVSGNISGSAGSVANALTLGTYLTGGTYNGSAAVTATVDATSANTASKVVARDSSGNFSAGTITATLSGSATSATTATNLAGGAANQIAYQSASGTTSFATAPSASNQVLSWNGSAFSWSAGTISGVPLGSNLNSLTAGTYLTGTAYNGSAAQTWTVDATSANTASKVVARDASGNFSAGTITASLSGNATSATNSTTTSQTNFSNLTIGGSQVLYAGNYNSYAPTLTGTGASGTWGISISGNAATATSATTATTSTYTTYINYISLGTGSVNVNYGSSAVLRIDGGSGAALQYAPLLHVAAGDTMWQAQGSYGSSGDGTLYFRQGYNGSWGNWLTMLSSYNYNSYAPTLTGTGASGTWNISITGSAGSAPGYLPLSGGTMTGTITGGSGVSSLVTGNYAGALRGYLYNDSSGFGLLTYAGNWGVRVDYGTNSVYIPGIGYSAASLRAPIFYDTDDTGYYVDPASTSNLNVVNLLSGKWYPVNNGSGNSAEIYVRPDNNNTYVWRHIYGGTSTGFGTGVGGYGIYAQHLGGNYSLLFSADGYVTAPYSFRAPIFYDSDNTSYYVNPASTSELNGVYYNSNMVSRNYGIGQVGLYSSYRYQAVFSMGESYLLPADGTTTGNLYGMAWSHPNAGGAAGNLNSHGLLLLQNGAFMAALSTNGTFSADVRGTIFYDYNNTGYYVDPSSASNMYEVYANNWFRTYGVTGLYSQSYASHFYPQNNGRYWSITGNGSTDYGGLLFKTNYESTIKGYVYWDTNGFGLLHGGGGWSVRGNLGAVGGQFYGSWFSDTDLRAPIFYDYNDTSYYVDPNSTSRQYQINFNYLYYAGDTSYGFLGSSVYADTINSGYAGDQLELNYYRGTFVSISHDSMRAPLFYDYDNTSFYLDPASSSVLNTIYQAGVYTRNAAGTGYLSGNYASSETAYTTGAIYTIGGSYYPTSTSFNTMYGIGYCYAPYISVGISGANGWGLYVNGSGVNNVWLGGEIGQVISTSEHRGTIFYDYNNTGYYVDPASTSLLYTVTCNNYGSAGSSLNINWPHSGYINFWGTTGQTLNINNASGLQVNLVVSGNVTAYSDERRKHDWQDVSENYVQRLAAVRSGTYMRSDGGSDIRQAGVGAQSFYNVLPEVVTADENGYLSLAYGNAALVSAVELAKYVTALEQRISQLEARI